MKKLTVSAKIIWGVAVLFLLALTTAAAALLVTGTLKGRFDRAVNFSVRKIVLADSVNIAESDMVAAQRLLMLGAAMKNNLAETAGTAFRERMGASREDLRGLAALVVTEEAKQLLLQLDANYTEWSKEFENLERAGKGGNLTEMDRIRVEKLSPLKDVIEKAALRLTEIQLEQLEADKASMTSMYSLVRWGMIGLVMLALTSGALVIRSVRRINRDLRRTVGEINEGAAQIASAASQVSASSQSLAQGASEQSASLEETSAAGAQISATAQKNTETSSAASQVVEDAQDRMTQTNSTLEEMVSAMREINDSSEKISKIIKVIDEVAFQTNILALNAAVEAARAGEAGMGFAVVADEVRNLAQRCAQAAQDTSGLIEESVTRSREGKTKVDRVAEAIRSTTQASAQIRTLVNEVNLSSQEQSRGVHQVATALSQMEHVTQRVAASAEESASASEELNAQSRSLKQVADRLSEMVGKAG